MTKHKTISIRLSPRVIAMIINYTNCNICEAIRKSITKTTRINKLKTAVVEYEKNKTTTTTVPYKISIPIDCELSHDEIRAATWYNLTLIEQLVSNRPKEATPVTEQEINAAATVEKQQIAHDINKDIQRLEGELRQRREAV